MEHTQLHMHTNTHTLQMVESIFGFSEHINLSERMSRCKFEKPLELSLEPHLFREDGSPHEHTHTHLQAGIRKEFLKMCRYKESARRMLSKC